MPERSLTPLLLSLKEDMQKKAAFLRYLKVSTKFIEPCLCQDPVHQYCISALVTRTKKIYCQTCNQPYKYFIKEEKICNTKLLKLIAAYIVVFAASMVATVGLMIIDGYLKYLHVRDHPEKVEALLKTSELEDVENFNFWAAIRWDLLPPVGVIILVILIWCFYFTY